MDALCFTVEIDDKHFPNIYDFITDLDRCNIVYMSNEFENNFIDGTRCYRFEFDDIAVSKVSSLLSELVKKNYLRYYAENIIETNYCGIEDSDKANLISSVLKYSDNYELTSSIREFIKENKHIHLNGFVLFRLKDFLENFDDEIDFAVDEYVDQKRYDDFVKFLKFFVDIQDTSFEIINLVVNKNGNYKILDGMGIPISKRFLDSAYCEIGAFDDNDEYIMLNDVISLAPKHITIHCSKSTEDIESIKILKEIFYGRVEFCNCCSICK